MDTGLDQNEAELRVLVLAVALEVLADSDSLEAMSELRITIDEYHNLTFLINM